MQSQELQKEHLDLLLQASALLNSTLSLDGVLAYLLREAVKIVRAQNGCILLLEDGDWKVQTAHPAHTEDFSFSRTILNQVVREQATVCLLDASQDASFGALSSVQCANLRSVICAPLLWRGEVRGAIYLDHRVSQGVFQEEQKRLVEALSQQSAVALENAALHEQREVLHEIALRQATDELAETQSQLFSAHELTAVIAHEVLGSVRDLSRHLKLVEAEMGQGRLDDLFKSVRDLQGLGEKFAAFIEPDRSKWKPFSLDQMVEQGLDLCVSSLDEVTIRRDLQATKITGDQAILSRVLLALLSNAEDALEKSEGEKEILVRCYQEDGLAILEVNDNGCGMTLETRERIFDPFFTTKDADYRSGLGLSVCLQVLRQYGAEILVDSQVGLGTRVTVTFPG